MWGTPAEHHDRHPVRRFIPTHVGNTPESRSELWIYSVHPHACGEHGACRGSGRVSPGSSPRMWGTLSCAGGLGLLKRFIPTHVGNTRRPPFVSPAGAVHPHACGEHARGDHQHPRAVGSSPRMWGTRRLAVPPDVRDRFIPTHVGNTSPLPSRASGTPVHPHACGEHSLSKN